MAIALFVCFELLATRGLAAIGLLVLLAGALIVGRLIRRPAAPPPPSVVVRHLGRSEERHYAW